MVAVNGAPEAVRVGHGRQVTGVSRARGPGCRVELVDVREAGEPAVVAGFKGAWRVDPAQLGRP
jgi:uncharacterized protein